MAYAAIIGFGGFMSVTMALATSKHGKGVDLHMLPWQPWWDMLIWIWIAYGAGDRLHNVLRVRRHDPPLEGDLARVVKEARRSVLLRIGEVGLFAWCGMAGTAVLIAFAAIRLHMRLGPDLDAHLNDFKPVFQAVCISAFVGFAAFGVWLFREESRIRKLTPSVR